MDILPFVAEQNLNVELARLLASADLKAYGEVLLSKHARPDIMLTFNGVRVIIEGKKSGGWDALIRQCNDRLESNECDICVMVEYVRIESNTVNPTQVDIAEALRLGRFNIGVRKISNTLERWGLGAERQEKYEDVDFHRLAGIIYDAYTELVSEDILTPVIDRIDDAVTRFAGELVGVGEANVERLKEVLELGGGGSGAGSDRGKVLSTAALLLLDAMVFQEVIGGVHPQIQTLGTIRNSSDLKKELEDSWRRIVREIDYIPIFDISTSVLETLSNTPSLNKALRRLLEVAYDVAGSKALLKHDLFGRIYHTLLLGKLAKYHATYYTSIPAARLLAELALADVDASKIPPRFSGEPLQVVDFACGSGTLLSAAYKVIEERHRFSSSSPNIPELHRYLIEEGLWGFDVLHHAVHLAATTLSMHNLHTVRRARLYVLPLGVQGRERYLGSLNFLRSEKFTPLATLEDIVQGGPKSVSVSEETTESVELPHFHVCIMNPPFTRSVGGNLLFGALPEDVRDKLQMEFSTVLRERKWEGIGQAGLGAAFTLLADDYLKEGGVLALVLPRAVLSGVSWAKVRRALLEGYHLKYVVTSYDAEEGWNFSENTELSEVLLVAKKGREGDCTLFINLLKKPMSELQAKHVAHSVLGIRDCEGLDIESNGSAPRQVKLKVGKGEDVLGEVYSARIGDEPIGAYNFFSQFELNKTQILLFKHNILRLPTQGVVDSLKLVPLEQVVKVGPDRNQVESTFTTSSSGAYDAFWGHEPKDMREVAQRPNARLAPKSGMEKQAIALWEKSGRLLIAERARLTTYRLLSVHVEKPVLSNVWWPATAEDEEAERAIAVWLNTTFGMLGLLSVAEVTQGPWVEFKKENLKRVPVPSAEYKRALAAIFQKAKPFESLPEEFRLAARGEGARVELDRAVLEAFGVDVKAEALTKLYEALVREPMLAPRPVRTR
jgi:type I restriction-modification system DNA methylase subunit